MILYGIGSIAISILEIYLWLRWLDFRRKEGGIISRWLVMPEDPNELVMIALFKDPITPYLCRAYLNHMGIPSVVVGDILSSTASNLLILNDAGIELRVRAKDADHAVEILMHDPVSITSE